MKPHKRLMNSLRAAENARGKIKFADWIKTQPASTRRGIARGNFQLPPYVAL